MDKETIQWAREVAQSIADDNLSRTEFSDVYEDEDLEDATDEELRYIHDLVVKSRAVLPD